MNAAGGGAPPPAVPPTPTSVGPKEAKDLVEGFPKPVKEAIGRKDAEGMKKKIEDAGGTAEVK